MGNAAEHWETTGTGGLQPYKGLDSNLFPLLFLCYRIRQVYESLPIMYYIFIAPFFCCYFLASLSFFFLASSTQRSRSVSDTHSAGRQRAALSGSAPGLTTRDKRLQMLFETD